MLRARSQGWKWTAALLLAAAAGCTTSSGTRVDSHHHMVSVAPEALFSTVYFISPRTERAIVFSDNALTVKVDVEKLLTIDMGDYTLVYLRPRVHITVTLENLTEGGPT